MELEGEPVKREVGRQSCLIDRREVAMAMATEVD